MKKVRESRGARGFVGLVQFLVVGVVVSFLALRFALRLAPSLSALSL